MATLLVSSIEWDCDGHDPVKDCGLPTTIIVTDAPDSWEADNESDDALSSAISDVYGFCHNGYNVEAVTPDVAGKTSVISTYLGIMEWPD